MADEIIEITDNDPDAAKARNRMETRKWNLSKALPKVFGNKLELEAKAGIVVVRLDDVDLAA